MIKTRTKAIKNRRVKYKINILRPHSCRLACRPRSPQGFYIITAQGQNAPQYNQQNNDGNIGNNRVGVVFQNLGLAKGAEEINRQSHNAGDYNPQDNTASGKAANQQGCHPDNRYQQRQQGFHKAVMKIGSVIGGGGDIIGLRGREKIAVSGEIAHGINTGRDVRGELRQIVGQRVKGNRIQGNRFIIQFLNRAVKQQQFGGIILRDNLATLGEMRQGSGGGELLCNHNIGEVAVAILRAEIKGGTIIAGDKFADFNDLGDVFLGNFYLAVLVFFIRYGQGEMP